MVSMNKASGARAHSAFLEERGLPAIRPVLSAHDGQIAG